MPGVPSKSVGPFWPADVARVQVGPGLAYWTVLSGLTLEPVRQVNHDPTRISMQLVRRKVHWQR
jgi:hypothetical protein